MDFILMGPIVGKSRMNLGHGQVRVLDDDLGRSHAHLLDPDENVLDLYARFGDASLTAASAWCLYDVFCRAGDWRGNFRRCLAGWCRHTNDYTLFTRASKRAIQLSER